MKTATGTALAVLHLSPPMHPVEDETVLHAAREVTSYHAPTGTQAERHARVAEATAQFIAIIVGACPAGEDRDLAVQLARQSKMWASAAVALENS